MRPPGSQRNQGKPICLCDPQYGYFLTSSRGSSPGEEQSCHPKIGSAPFQPNTIHEEAIVWGIFLKELSLGPALLSGLGEASELGLGLAGL